MWDLQRTMTSREFQEWIALYEMQPWGDDWQQTGVIAAAQVNLWSKRSMKPEQFIPGRARRTPREVEARLKQFAAIKNAYERSRHGDNR